MEEMVEYLTLMERNLTEIDFCHTGWESRTTF
jgi:hypothetical protein